MDAHRTCPGRQPADTRQLAGVGLFCATILLMEIVKVTHYEDRGLLRAKIEWVDGESRGVADTHCTLTGQALGPNHTLCVRHCRGFGHFSRDANAMVGKLVAEKITQAEMDHFMRTRTRFPDLMDDNEQS